MGSSEELRSDEDGESEARSRRMAPEDPDRIMSPMCSYRVLLAVLAVVLAESCRGCRGMTVRTRCACSMAQCRQVPGAARRA